MTDRPELQLCLAYAVLQDPESWLGLATPSLFARFLDGAEQRASLTCQMVPAWRIRGPLDRPGFAATLVARTGHATLSIGWPHAVEFVHWRMSEAMLALRDAFLAELRDRPLDAEVRTAPPGRGGDIRTYLARLAARPAMYGIVDGWSLHCHLAGLDAGGDWLGLPELPGLRDIIVAIEDASRQAYGSAFAGYRAYAASPAELLKWAGIG